MFMLIIGATDNCGCVKCVGTNIITLLKSSIHIGILYTVVRWLHQVKVFFEFRKGTGRDIIFFLQSQMSSVYDMSIGYA